MRLNKQFFMMLVAVFVMIFAATMVNAEQLILNKKDTNSINNSPSISGFVKRFGATIHYAEINLRGIGLTGDVELNTVSNTQGFYTFTDLPAPQYYDQWYEITATKEINGKEWKGDILVLITHNDFIKEDQDISIKKPKDKSLAAPFMNLVLKNILLKENLMAIFCL